MCAGSPVAVLGGGNSAGQAALFLASKGCEVRILIRGENLSASMSRYLIDRIEDHPHVTVESRTEVRACTATSASGASRSSARRRAAFEDIELAGLFCFIGAVPSTGWLAGCLATDAKGFLRTDRDLTPTDLGEEWAALGREPLPFETSVPGVFAVGDVRAGQRQAGGRGRRRGLDRGALGPRAPRLRPLGPPAAQPSAPARRRR